MAENISKIILNGTEYVIKDAATQYHTINGQSITGGTGDITITGGGGSSYTAGDGIDITNDVISVTGKVDTSTYSTYTAATDTALASKADTATTYTKTEVDTALSGYVTKNTRQEITGNKTFIGSSNTGEKPIIFKQANNNHKIGFICKNTAEINNEVATFEFRPNTFTIDGVKHPLMYFGHYRNTQTANDGVPQTVIGFRQYDELNAAAYHYLIPLPEKAKTPFSLTTSFKDYYAPMGFKNGSTMITADNTGVVDLSSEFSGKQDALVSGTNVKTINGQSLLGSGDITITGGSGLKKWEGTRAEYNALSSYDADTLYVITDEDVEIPVVPTKVSAFENDAGYALKSNSEEITFTLEDGSTVKKKFVLG